LAAYELPLTSGRGLPKGARAWSENWDSKRKGVAPFTRAGRSVADCIVWIRFRGGRSCAARRWKQRTLKQLSLAQLADVEVTTTSKEPEEIWKTPAAVYLLTQEDIRRSGATNIPEVLRLVPESKSAASTMTIGRSAFADLRSVLQVMLVLVDGRSLYTPLFAGVYWALQDGILLEDVQRIEVVRAPGATSGGKRSHGRHQHHTKSARDTRGTLASAGAEILIKALVDSGGSYSPQAL